MDIKKFCEDLKNAFEDSLENIDNLGTYYDDFCESDDIDSYLTRHGYKNFNIRCGVSKMAIVFKNENFVIKVPFNGRFYDKDDEDHEHYSHEEDEDDDSDFYEAEPDKYFEPFFQAGNDYDETDYCLTELEVYEEMIDRGFEKFFARTDTIPYAIGVHQIYKQEKIHPSSSGFSPTVSDKSLSLAEDMADCFDETWIAAAIDFYGEDLTREFLDYINNSEASWIGDFHAGNYGYRDDGSPCILDYSGWND